MDAGEFSLWFALAMENSRADKEEALAELFDRVCERYPDDPVKRDSFVMRFSACMAIMDSNALEKQFPGRDQRVLLEVMRLAATFSIGADGEFSADAFLTKIAATL